MKVYVYKAALYCEACGSEIRTELTAKGKAPKDPDDEYSYDSDNFPKGPTDEGESDTPSHCDGCGIFLESKLTSDGEAYVIEAVREARSRCDARGEPLKDIALTEWALFYDYLDFGPVMVTCAKCGKQVADEDSWGVGDVGDSSMIMPSYCSKACYDSAEWDVEPGDGSGDDDGDIPGTGDEP